MDYLFKNLDSRITKYYVRPLPSIIGNYFESVCHFHLCIIELGKRRNAVDYRQDCWLMGTSQLFPPAGDYGDYRAYDTLE